MPTSTSAKKRVRQNATQQARNNWRKRRVRVQIKTFLKAVQEQDVKAAETEFRKTCGILDKVACTSSMHRNAAARKKSRLSKRLVALKTAKA